MFAAPWSRPNTHHLHPNHKSRLAASCNLMSQSHRPHLCHLSRAISLLWIHHHLQARIPALLSHSIDHLHSIVHLHSTGHLHSTARLRSTGHQHSTAHLRSIGHQHSIDRLRNTGHQRSTARLRMRLYKSSMIPSTKILPRSSC